MRQLPGFRNTYAIVSGLVLVLVAGFASATASAASRKPNLVPTGIEVGGSQYAVRPLDATLSWKDTTSNRGEATAGRSRTALVLFPDHNAADRFHTVYPIVSRRIPKLRPGHSDRGGTSKEFSTKHFPHGSYTLGVCADDEQQVNESREGNCVKTKRHFYVVEHQWSGSVSGGGTVFGRADLETWGNLIDDVHLRFIKYLGKGVFSYDLFGTVLWLDNGTDMYHCTWNGSGTKEFSGTYPPGANIQLDYRNGKYFGSVADNAVPGWYTITLGGACSGGTRDGPRFPDILTINNHKLLFDQQALKGSYAIPSTVHWKWDLKPDTPPLR